MGKSRVTMVKAIRCLFRQKGQICGLIFFLKSLIEIRIFPHAGVKMHYACEESVRTALKSLVCERKERSEMVMIHLYKIEKLWDC